MKLSLPIYLVLLLLLTIAVTLTSTTSEPVIDLRMLENSPTTTPQSKIEQPASSSPTTTPRSPIEQPASSATSPSLSESDDAKYREAQYEHLASRYTYSYLLKTTTDLLIPDTSLIECVATSLTKETEYFSYDEVKQLCKIYSPKNILTVTTGQNTSEMAYYRMDKWIKVYALSMGANSLVYNSFLNIGNASTWKVEKCVGNFCPNFFRHPILDIWKELPIYKIKLTVSKNQTDVVKMAFKGRKTSIDSWFSEHNAIGDLWKPSGPFDIFSMKGIGSSRRFYVNHKHTICDNTTVCNCKADTGWLIISEKSYNCSYEKSTFYPTILYSNLSTKVRWMEDPAVADSMAISILLKPQ